MLEHGGNLNAAAQQYGIPLEEWLDLSTGINPDGYPVPQIPAELWQRLPLLQDTLADAALAYYGARHVLATAGSQASIQALPGLRSSCRVALCSTTYNEHAASWQKHGHQISSFADIPNAQLLKTIDVLVICNPNNPTGKLIATDILMAWHAQLSKRNGWLVVDEAFMDATPEHSVAGYAHLPNLIVLRSLGKFFGLAGARVGFALAEQKLLLQLEDALGPWTVSGPARLIAATALNDRKWQDHSRNQLQINSERLLTMLGEYGLAPDGGTALFQWVPTADAIDWHSHLARNGIWARLFTKTSALRFGLPPHQDWQRLQTALASFNG